MDQRALHQPVLEHIGRALLGKERKIRLAMTCLLAGALAKRPDQPETG
ncbi:hypothetical protein [Synechococcus sp. Tobar12-5m-g]|nr:hypothetical protein [Synechococcus sp. Tobar12-5m-g]